MPTTRTITIDPAVGARYISLSDRPVASTEEFSDSILVDLDEFGVAVGMWARARPRGLSDRLE